MKSLFDPNHNSEIITRINTLKPDSKAEWGKMTVSQMMAHSTAPLLMAYGDAKGSKRGLLGILFGGMMKKKYVSGAPVTKNLPTDKTFIITDERKFEEEKQKLITQVQRFLKDGPDKITNDEHPFFGKMSAQEWDIMQHKHLDHHLRQFGA